AGAGEYQQGRVNIFDGFALRFVEAVQHEVFRYPKKYRAGILAVLEFAYQSCCWVLFLLTQ
ncbi:MAG: hypothetical protein RLN82_07090, partial [Pseudomonadales bacterium]